VPENHVAPEKVAFERHLLLGDPDWSDRTIADRNTLPRKKQYEYVGPGSISPPPEDVYYESSTAPPPPYKSPDGGYKSPAADGGCRVNEDDAHMEESSRKSSGDDVFCPACAHHSSSQQNSSNRESRDELNAFLSFCVFAFFNVFAFLHKSNVKGMNISYACVYSIFIASEMD
jgi:hypothetical protein